MKKLATLTLSLMLVLCLAAAGTASAETLTMLQRLPAEYVVEGNPVIEAWGEMFDIDIDIEAPPISSYNDRRNVIMASGDLPDILYVGDTAALYTQWAQEGLLLDLTPYFNAETMPNAFAVLTEEELAYTTVQLEDGSTGLFSLPRVQTKPEDAIIYRGDWLEKLGLDIPTTPAEFAAVMEAFATQDPDGNGLDDTYGWSLNTVNTPEYRSIVSGFGVRPSEVPDENGEYTVMQAQPAYMEYLDWMRGMYQTGAMDQEFYLTKMYEDDDNFKAGKAGCVSSTKLVEHLITLANDEAFVGANPGAYLVAGPALMQEGEEVANVYYPPQIWGNYAISADSDNIELAIRFLDAGYTDDVNNLLAFGLEGITYEEFFPEERYATRTEEQKLNAAKYVATYATINYQRADKSLLIANGDSAEQVAEFNEANDRLGAVTNHIAYLGENVVPGFGEVDIVMEESGIRDEWKELRTKYITGEIDKETLQDFIDNKFVPANAAKMELFAGYNSGAGVNQ